MDLMDADSNGTPDLNSSKSPNSNKRNYRRPISCDTPSTTIEATTAPPPASTLNQNGRNSADGTGKKKKKNRRAKRRRWKPYHKLSSEEKREMDRKQEEKAERIRAERLANGQPMAPYNTTQFLVEDLESRTVESLLSEASHHRERTTSGSLSLLDSEGSMYSGTSSGGESVGDPDELEFEAEYENAEAERLEAIPKPELVRQYMQLSHRLEHAEKTNADLQKQMQDLIEEHQLLKTSAKSHSNCTNGLSSDPPIPDPSTSQPPDPISSTPPVPAQGSFPLEDTAT